MKKNFTQFLALALCCFSLSAIAQVSFVANPNNGCSPLTVTFVNTTTAPGAYEYQWNFGDGSATVFDIQTTSINHIYVNKGTYQVSVNVYNVFGAYLGQYSSPVIVNGLSSYDQLYLYPYEACPGQDVSINAPWGYPAYIFNYGDGSVDTITANWKNHKYSAPGDYLVSVKILNVCNGNDTTLSDTVSIKSTMYFNTGGGTPGGGMYYSTYPSEACPGENVSFYTGWGYAGYIWNFGDGTIDSTTSANINHNFSSTGLYPVSVKIFNYCGDDTTLYDTVNVRYLPFPPVSLNSGTSFSNESACPGEQVYFNAPWGYVYYVWDFGDGSPLDSGNYSYKNYSYPDTGTYIVSVKIRQLCGNDTTLFDTIRVGNYVPFPNWVNLSAYPDPACPFKEINFYGAWGYSQYQWAWGDGTPAQVTTTSYKTHTYTSGGTYNVSLTMTNLCGNDTTLTYPVTIDPNLPFPTGSLLSIDNGSPACPGNVSFTANNSFQYYQWNFGDGNTQITSTGNVSHSYPALGNYTVSVKLIDHCGKDTTVSLPLTIQYQFFPNSMQINIYDDNSCPGEKIQFNAPWGYVSYNWNFGDGTALTGSNYVNHTYSAVGQYIVTVKVKQLCGNDTTLTKIVKVINNQTFPNWVNLNAYPGTACPGEEISFYGPWDFASYIWDFGDGVVDTTTNAYTNHQYSSGGTYSASLKVFNFCGLDTTLNVTVQVDSTLNISNPMLNVWFSNGMSSCPGEMVNFNGSWGYPNYTWDFGDGSTPLSGEFNFINYSYSEAGTYIAALTIENYCGNDTTVTQTITIDGNKPIGMMPMINVSPMNPSYCPGLPITFSGPSGFASYLWNFGDGTPVDSTTSNMAMHSFSSPGNYSVSLKIINYCGNDTTATTTVSITNTLIPFTNIDVYPNPICPDQKVVLEADAGFVSYYWNFGDGFAAYGSENVNHSYSAMGNYQASVVLTNYCNNSDTFFASITVDTATSFPSWMSLWGGGGGAGGGSCPGELTTLNTQPGFSSYFWDFGDGDTITTTGSTIDHIYDAEGNYTASVTINNGCGNSTTLTTSITIDGNSSVNPPHIFTAQNAYCPEDAVMFLLNDWGNGTAQNYTYYWDFGDGNADTTYGIGAIHIYDSADTYTTLVTILNQCGNSSTKIVPVNIKDNTAPALNSNLWGMLAQTSIAGCPGDAVVFYFQGTGDNFWDFGDGSDGVASEEFINSNGVVTTVIKHAYSAEGTYKVALTLTNGCGNSVTDTLTIQIMSDFLVDGGLILEPPKGTNSYTTCRELNFIAYGGSSYEWDFGDGNTLTTISPTVSHIYSEPGSYAVGVLITNECGYSTYFSNAINISESGGPSADSALATDAVCFGGSSGTASVIISGGEAPYTYVWSDESAQTGSTASGLPAGIYSVTITDALGCETETSVTVGEADKIELSASSINTACGSSSGSASVSVVSGGNPSFSYSWSDGSSAALASSLGSGTYSVTVTDADGCYATAMAAVSDNGGPSLTVDNITDITCNGNSNGSITTTASGTNSPFTYLWSDNKTTDDISNLSAGDYSVTVTDTAGCKTVDILTVSEPEELSLNFSFIGTECGEANGSASVSVSGGTPGYSYQWDSNAGSKVTATVTGLSANAYRVTVTDANSCSAVGVVTINNSNAPTLSASKTNISCPGISDGAINLTVTKGTTPYSFIWSWTGGSSFIEDLNGLNPGVYTVMVQDASNCWVGTSVTLTEPAYSTAIAVSDATCVGSSNGSASVTATGGASPYTYLWSGSETGSSVTGLAAGTYTVQVTDTNNCTITDTAIVGQPAALAIALSGTNVSCYGGSNGTAAVTASGGSAPYSYLWNNGSTTGSVSVLSAGKYYVTVSDSCGTSKIDSVTVSQPAQLIATMSKTNITCYGGGDGTALVSVSGGTSPYNYSWNNGQTTAAAYGLFPGLHSVNVFDANGCLVSNNITITQPQPLSATTSVSYVSCFAGSDGSVDVTVNGGTSPYSFNWSNSATTEDVSGLAAGSYSVTITDSCGSSVTQSVQITEPGALSLTKVVSEVKCNGANNGSVNLSVSGGVGPYSYSWSNSAVTEDISNLGTATYYVTVTDACGQTSQDSAVVNQPATLTTTISKTNVSCNGMGDGTATVNASGGTSPFIYNWNNGQTSQTAVGLFPGTYGVNVVDANGCLASNSITITQPQVLSATTSVSYVSCFAGSDGSVDVTVNGGTSPFSFNWSNSATTEDVSGLAAGSYSVTITDSCGSSVTQSVQITEPGALSLTKVVSEVKCNGANNGSVNLSVSGGVTPYSYNWSNSAVAEDISSLSPGTYYITVTDGCGLVSVDSAVVNQPATLTTTISKANISCNGLGDGTATVNASGGTSPFIYNWNNGQTSQTAVGLFPGTYGVNVVDANGCLASNSVTITQPQLLSATTSVSYVSCFAGSDGSVDVTVNGGTSPFSFNWSNSATTEDVSGLAAGSYSVTITDSCGSSVTQSVQITEPGALSLTKVISEVKCNGAGNGSVNLSVSGGVTPYSYSWSNSDITEDISNLSAATYYVTVTDACGQISLDSAVVSQPAALTSAISKTDVSCYGLGDGDATVSVSGGTPPYIYQWNNAQNTSTAVGLFAGFYSVNVFDANNCLTSNSVLVTQPQPLNVVITASGATCGNMDAFASASASGGTQPYAYLWSNAGVDSIASGLATGAVGVTVTDASGCVSSSDVSIEIFVPTVDICIVTVDSSNTKNLVVWEKPMVNYIDSFRIYRDIVGTYTYIGSIDYSDLSKFVDYTFGINPSITSYRYKVSAIDTCGNESALSSLHKTIHLTTNLGTQGEANLIWDAYDGFGLTNFYYRILRDSTGTGNYEVLDSVSNSNFTYSDWNVPGGSVNYVVEVVHPFGGCLATKSVENHNSSRSNRGQAMNGSVLSAMTTVTDASTPTSCDGTATVAVTGGTTPYTYQWDAGAGNQTTATATGLCAGSYDVTVTDDNGNSIVTYAVVDVMVDVREITSVNNAVIYPNPNKGQFTLELVLTGTTEVRIYDVLGQEINTGIKLSSGKNIIRIDIGRYGSGIYNLQLISEDGIINKPVIIE